MGYTEQDAMADLADQEDEWYPSEEEFYRDLLGEEVTSNELNAYASWLTPGMKAAEALNKSGTRVVITTALAGMPNFMIDSERDDALELPGVSMLEAIVPPEGDPAWASYGRPSGLFHQLHRMEGNDKNGKSVDLIEVGYYPSEPDAMGKVMKAYKLTRTGVCYAHFHGAVSKDVLVRYWRHVTHGNDVAATNPYYLAMTGGAPSPDDSVYQYDTPGSVRWGVLASLMREDRTIPERYRADSPNKIRTALGHVYANDASEALKFLHKDDQWALAHDVLLHSNVDNETVRDQFIDGLMRKDVTYPGRVAQLTDVYLVAHPDSDAERIVMELICRAVWAVIRRVMDYRMADDYESAMRHPLNQAPDRVTEERLLVALARLETAKKDLAVLGATATGYEGEYEIDHPGPARLG